MNPHFSEALAVLHACKEGLARIEKLLERAVRENSGPSPSIVALPFSPRIISVLAERGIRTVADLREITPRDLKRINGLGPKGQKAITIWLRDNP